MKRPLVILSILLLLAVTAAKLIVFDFPRIDGDDMAPAIQRGDWLLVYRLDKAPARGDLVLLQHPQRQRLLVRRVIGLPGETVSVEREVPVVDGRPARRRVVGTARLGQNKMRLVEERIGEARYTVLKDPKRRSVDARRVRLVGAYYVMSDNRNHGTGSRTFGAVPSHQIRGIVTHRLFAGDGSIADRPPRESFTRIE